MDFNLTKKPGLIWIATEFFSIQLHSKSGFFISKTFVDSTFILIIYLNFITFRIF